MLEYTYKQIILGKLLKATFLRSGEDTWDIKMQPLLSISSAPSATPKQTQMKAGALLIFLVQLLRLLAG